MVVEKKNRIICRSKEHPGCRMKLAEFAADHWRNPDFEGTFKYFLPIDGKSWIPKANS